MDQDAQKRKFEQMTEAPVEALVCKMAVPTIISMLITSIYNMADTFFVGRIGTSATGAVGVIFPLMAIIQAVGFFFGQGSGTYISRQLGAQNRDEAARMASTGFFSSLGAGCVILAVGLLFQGPLCRLLGATDTIYPYALSYMRVILLGAPYMTAALVLNNQLRLQGNAIYAMVGLVSGGLLNIVLDPMFIFGLNMGIAGAALATILSQLVSFCLLLCGVFRSGGVPLRLRLFSPSLQRYRALAAGGIPSLLRQGLASVATVCLNTAAGPFGDAAIAAMSIVTRVSQFAGSALLGFGQGFQPVCGFNYGAKRFDRVTKAFWFCVRVSTVALIARPVLPAAGCHQVRDGVGLDHHDYPAIPRQGRIGEYHFAGGGAGRRGRADRVQRMYRCGQRHGQRWAAGGLDRPVAAGSVEYPCARTGRGRGVLAQMDHHGPAFPGAPAGAGECGNFYPDGSVHDDGHFSASGLHGHGHGVCQYHRKQAPV